MKFYFGFFILFIAACSSCFMSNKNAAVINDEFLRKELNFLSEKMVNYQSKLKIDSLMIPRSLNEDGSLLVTNSKNWTSGFYPGTLWQLYGYSKEESLKESAIIWTSFVEKEKWDIHTHDLGFKISSCFGKGYKLEKNEAYKDVIIQASATLIKRFNAKIGVIRSWDWNADKWQFPVIIDNMMNLEMLFDATELSGDSIYYKVAYQHAKTTLHNHFRKDNSSYHVVDYDTLTGQPRLKITHQGYSDESAWSRGQAWGLYGFTTAFGRTGDSTFLKQAKLIGEYYFNHPNLPKDKIPYWDFNAPNIPNEPRDVSAATVMASGLIELANYVPGEKMKYLNMADQILSSLSKKEYQSEVPPFLLSQSTGSLPGNFEIDVPLSYADYYYVEALIRRLSGLKSR
ncbi:MAG: glycoside hydrolase family 88 protein [Saprospiraceae bacterium]|jgi:hypothetical protein|nr:glycoside hydrolase family 88 protein [Saprospiraceae bacterium]